MKVYILHIAFLIRNKKIKLNLLYLLNSTIILSNSYILNSFPSFKRTMNKDKLNKLR